MIFMSEKLHDLDYDTSIHVSQFFYLQIHCAYFMN